MIHAENERFFAAMLCGAVYALTLKRAFIEQPFCAPNAQGLRCLNWRGPNVPGEQPRKMPHTHAKTGGEVFDRSMIQRAVLDHLQGTLYGRPRSLPCRTKWRSLGAASQTGTIACPLGRCGCRVIDDIFRQRMLHRAHWTAIDACRSDSGKEQSVISRIAPQSRIITGVEIKHALTLLFVSKRGEALQMIGSENCQPQHALASNPLT